MSNTPTVTLPIDLTEVHTLKEGTSLIYAVESGHPVVIYVVDVTTDNPPLVIVGAEGVTQITLTAI